MKLSYTTPILSILAVAQKCHHSLGASCAQRDFKNMRPLEMELIFSGAVITSITVADRESVFVPSKVDFDTHINYACVHEV